jgi:hypothetical protein
MDKTAR